MQKIFRVAFIEVDSYHHFKSFFKKSDAEEYLEVLKKEIERDAELFEKMCIENDEIHKKVREEFSVPDGESVYDNDEACEMFDRLMNLVVRPHIEYYYTKDELEFLKIYEEEVF